MSVVERRSGVGARWVYIGFSLALLLVQLALVTPLLVAAGGFYGGPGWGVIVPWCAVIVLCLTASLRWNAISRRWRSPVAVLCVSSQLAVYALAPYALTAESLADAKIAYSIAAFRVVIVLGLIGVAGIFVATIWFLALLISQQRPPWN